MPPRTEDHGRVTNHRGRTTVLVVSLAAFATGAAAMLLGYEEALALMVLALLGAAFEVVSALLRPSKRERPDGERR